MEFNIKDKRKLMEIIAVSIILIILIVGIAIKLSPKEIKFSNPPCYYFANDTIKLYGINESDYGDILVLTDNDNSSFFRIIDSRDENNTKEIVGCIP